MIKSSLNLRVLLACAACALVVVLAAEAAARLTLARTDAVVLPADIQTRETLCIKIEHLRSFDGHRVVVLGDSLALGEAMRRHGNADWRWQEVGHAIAATLSAEKPVIVMNLGLNGGLPADQEVVLKLLRGIRLDSVVSFVSIRSFSADFAQPKDAFSRAWFADLAKHGCQRFAKGDMASRVRAALNDSLVLYRARDLLQRFVFDDSLLGAVISWRTRWGTATASVGDSNPQETLFLARRRYLNITFEAPHRQVEAFESMNAALKAQAERTIYVYGREAPRQLPSLLGRQAYLRNRQQLAELIGQRCGLAYLDNPDMPAERYLDYVHVDAEGYRILAKQIAVVAGGLKSCDLRP